MTDFEFAESSYSGGDAGQQCVEVARNIVGAVAVRDSKEADGPILQLTPGTWTALLKEL
ncbi:DUF397 domain-containing protein [Streptomyces sp. NPDC006385]|uniref:DUF397 domain-containing protein n=1 Tax=Streptomyces sp. NPDC006385 TaxID=3156761 RepID=UPI0033BA9925